MKTVADAGGEAVLVYPTADIDFESRFAWVDGVLLPGGADVDPLLYADHRDGSVYGVDRRQDDFDIALSKWALDRGVPTLAICRGFQVINVALGGTLEQDMAEDHRDRMHTITVTGAIAGITGPTVEASCFHHQRVEKLAEGLRVLATDHDGTIEAVDRPDGAGWFFGLQWHPEDTADTDGHQAAIFAALVDAAEKFASGRR
jgi:putative glutamine amidotransferase